MSFRLGRIWGIAIEIDVSWFVVFVLVAWSLSLGYFPRLFPNASAGINWVAGIAAALLFFFSVLLHELAHSYVAIRNGLPIRGITLFLFGGVSRIQEEPRTPQLELKMAAAGPLCSFVLGGIFWALSTLFRIYHVPAHVWAVCGYLAIINVMLGVFNLVPGFPLDGGRVLRAILWRTSGNLERATRYASYAGQGFGYLLMAWGIYQLFGGNFINGAWLVFIGWFLANAAQNAYQQLILRRALSGVPVERIMQRDVPRVSPDLPLRELVDEYFMRQDYQAYPVVESDTLAGIVSIEDVREVPREAWGSTTVRQVARRTDEHQVIEESEDAWDALMQMVQANVRRILVVHDNHLEGVVSRDSILQLVRAKMQLQM